jgi:hypothetical protein
MLKSKYLILLMLPVFLWNCTKPVTKKPVEKKVKKPVVKVMNYGQIKRTEFNKKAVRLNLPVYWVLDVNKNKIVEPSEVVELLFYPAKIKWVKDGKFTKEFETAYNSILGITHDKKDERLNLVVSDLDQGRSTLVYNDLSKLSKDEKDFVTSMLKVASLIDALYQTQSGVYGLDKNIPETDFASRSLLRRNRTPKCLGPKTEKNPACGAIKDLKQFSVAIYPAEIQKIGFCKILSKEKNHKKLMSPFVVVQKDKKGFKAVEYNVVFKDLSLKISTELKKAETFIKDPKEKALKTYLLAAAKGFETNDWDPPNEAWSKMNALNSKWYVRVGPDETYWEPCSSKAGYHLTFAKINMDSLAWQKKLKPVQQEMEDVLAKLINSRYYKKRKVSFHFPDFIDIVVNAGDDRKPFGATIGQSLPNWGPVANEGRGRTVAMSNLYTDPDSLKIRKITATSLFTKESLEFYNEDTGLGLLSTILHEAAHNLGPAHEYKYRGKKDRELFGGSLAVAMEELKAQTAALWYIDFLLKKKILTPKLAKQTYMDSFFWTMGHISRGMRSSSGKLKPYSALAAIQVGYLISEGAVKFDLTVMASNNKDKGAFVVDLAKFPAVINKLMKIVGKIKATGNKKKAEQLIKKYVDSTIVPHKIITERVLRNPKASFVYSVKLSE